MKSAPKVFPNSILESSLKYSISTNFWLLSNRITAKNRSSSLSGGSCTHKATLVERPQIDVEQFLARLRFENRSKVEELI
jgi:hypothetical protein